MHKSVPPHARVCSLNVLVCLPHITESKTALGWANPNGVYYSGKYSNQDADGIKWVTLRGHKYSFKRIEMKVKPKV